MVGVGLGQRIQQRRRRLRRKYTYDDTRSPFGAEVGRVKRYSHIRGSQPRLASLVCPFQRKGRE